MASGTENPVFPFKGTEKRGHTDADHIERIENLETEERRPFPSDTQKSANLQQKGCFKDHLHRHQEQRLEDQWSEQEEPVDDKGYLE